MKHYLERSSNIFPIEPAAPLAAHWAVIPVYNENEFIAQTLASVAAALARSPEKVNILLVINEPLNAPPAAQRSNQKLLQSLRNNDGKYDGDLVVGENLFFIDLTDKDIAPKYRNVGNARKSGFDSAINQSSGAAAAKDQLLFSLDADTLISEDYFCNAFNWFKLNSDAAAAVFHFEHRWAEDAAAAQSAMRYEIYLRDYAWKVRECGSIFGFWTIGSAFVCRVGDYVRCGGMRRCAAGEDFYFLQALRKVGRVGVIPQSTVYPAGRLSDRVPFGTGPAIAKDIAESHIALYHPGCFALLKNFFSSCSAAGYELLSQDVSDLAPGKLQIFLQEQDFSAIWQKIVRNTPKNAPALLKALQIYCDGFFIMKFCHYLEEKYPAEFARRAISGDLKAEVERLRELDRRRYF